jgi:hypothetical protein
MSEPVSRPSTVSLEANSPGAVAVEKAQNGYPKLAWLMSTYPDNAIFRRFGELNMLNLLRLQAEIHEMEQELKRIRDEDKESEDVMRMAYVNDFCAMRDNQEEGDSEQYDLLIRIGEKLQEYNSALALSLQLKGADQPTARELGNLREWLNRPKGGNCFLIGEEASMGRKKFIKVHYSISALSRG